MNKKQKTMLYRIIIAAVLVAAVTVLEKILELNVWIAAVLYMVPYFVEKFTKKDKEEPENTQE